MANLVFDFDGTLCDTNHIKRASLISALNALSFGPNNEMERYADKFIAESGVSRELKLFRDFAKTQSTGRIQALIDEYSTLTIERLQYVVLDKKTIDCLNKFKLKNSLFILTGGRISEVVTVLQKTKNIDVFDAVISAQMPKHYYLSALSTLQETVFFGDSKVDEEAARKSGVQFNFVNEFSSLRDGEIRDETVGLERYL